jgi:osmotically-inducible protein OsmY
MQSDVWIESKVKLALLFHRSVLDLAEVEVKNGVVRLYGLAQNKPGMALISEFARDVDGVTCVHNRMTVATSGRLAPAKEKIQDATITAQIEFTLLQNRFACAMNIQLETTAGVVTLRGVATKQFEIDLVTRLVRDIEGVTEVKNEMNAQLPLDLIGTSVRRAGFTLQRWL